MRPPVASGNGWVPFVVRTGVVWGGHSRLSMPTAQPKCLVRARVNEGMGSRNA